MMTQTYAAPTRTDYELWEAILWSTSDGSNDQGGDPLDKNYSILDVFPGDLARLNDQYWQFVDQLSDQWPESLNDLSDNELCSHFEQTYILVRDGHGVSFADGWLSDSPEHRLAQVADKLARAQGEIGAYACDDGKVYCYWSL